MNSTHPSTLPSWSQLLLAAVLVGLVSGAYWLKVRPTPAPSKSAREGSTDSLVGLGVHLQQVRQYDGALAAYKQLLQRDPANPHAHYNIAQIYNERGQHAEAQREYEAALRADPQFLDARLNLGCPVQAAQFTAAAEAFRQVLQASPTHPALAWDAAPLATLDSGCHSTEPAELFKPQGPACRRACGPPWRAERLRVPAGERRDPLPA